jgi:hypothetical protein
MSALVETDASLATQSVSLTTKDMPRVARRKRWEVSRY